MKINLQIDQDNHQLVLEDNVATEELLRRLADGPIELTMALYDEELVQTAALDQALPTADRQVRTQAGDLVLASGRDLALYLGRNSWIFTPIGRIADLEEETVEGWKNKVRIKLKLYL